ncbi:MAG TPA: solute carrier 26 family protein, partial [Polyangiaceae bacterium]|nr:solute carrier 26 family protein [Polyangiaceae bacterium]
RGYDRATFRSDLLAGLTTAVMLIPQAMGYAMLAGLPPIIGLYASLLPLVVYALFGTSRQLAVGPVAMVSLLVAAGVGAVAEPGSSSFVAYAIMLSLGVGIIQTGMGLLRLGFLVNFLSHPVISGFTSAAALIIGFSQLKHVLGVDIARSHHIHTILLSAIQRASEIHLVTLAIGLGALIALVALKRFAPMFPRALAVVVASTLLVWGLDLHESGVGIVGAVPEGLPSLALPAFDFTVMKELLPVALTISLVGFMESIAVAKRYARDNRYEVDANRELIGLGLANVAGAFSQAYPVTGGFSRTAVNAQAGAKTGVAAIITAVAVGVTLLLLTPLFYFLPKAVLAAIILAAVFGLIDVAEVAHLWKVKRSDLLALVVTFVATLSLGIEQGIAVGVAVSLLTLVLRTTRPHVAELGRLPGTGHYRNVDRFPEAEREPGVLALRLDAQIYFGNVNFLKERLDELEARRDEPLKVVVIDASGVNQVDASAEVAFREILDGYRRRGIALRLANVKGPVRDVFARSGFTDEIGPEAFFMSVEDAIDAVTDPSASAAAPVSSGSRQAA